MDLREVRRALRRFWLPSLTVLILTVAAGYAAATRGGATFESTATISVAPNPAIGNSGDSVGYHLAVIVERVGSRTFWNDLIERVPADVADKGGWVLAENEVGTGIVRVIARGRNRGAVAEIANAAAAEIIARYTPSELVPGVAVEAADVVVVELIDAATPDDGTGKRPLAPVMLASAVLGAILAVGCAVVAQRSLRSLDPATRIRNEVGIPVLAQIPSTPELDAKELDLSELLTSGPAPVVESFQGLRTRVEVFLREPGSTLAITSWQRGEGRTTITAGLAMMLSAVGRDTVAIDTDLRHPQLHERLGEPLAVGLAEFDKFGASGMVTPTLYPKLEMVAGGIAKGHPAPILAVALPETLEQIRATEPEPVVLIDAPALRPVREGGYWLQLPAETSTVLRAARRVLLVIDAASTHLPEVAAIVERLREDDVVVVGAVLNRRRRTLLKLLARRRGTPRS